jgi:hypothetical protein
LLEVATAWSALAVAAFVLTLAAGVGTVLTIASIERLRRDAKVVEAAESFEPVDLSAVVRRYVPAEDQTNVAQDEIAIIKQVVVARRSRLKRVAGGLGLVLVCGAIATVFSADRYLETPATARSATQPQSTLDVLKVLQGGVWGWRADFLESCAENPQTIQVAPDRRTLTMHFAKPYKQGSEAITDMTFDVVSVEHNKLVLLRTDPAAFTVGKPTQVDVLFLDENTMIWSPSHGAMVSSGTIERCPPTQHSPTRQ